MAQAVWACRSCAGENPAGMRFCGHCGTPAGETPEPDTEVADVLRSFVATQVADRLVEAGGQLQEERRLVTALFADLSGFTPLADRLDPEQLLEVIDPLIALLTDIVGRHGGYVEKFAGDALLAFFGAPVAHEDDAARALRVAAEMHRGLARALTDLPPEAGHLTLHVGVNSGHAVARVIGASVRMDYAVLGDAVILAQRLEAAAPPDETYVGAMTYELTKDDFEFEAVGPLEIKGKAEPVPAWRLVGERADDRRAPRRLVGRAREVAVVEREADRVVAGHGGVCTVTGEPGIGKSALTAHLRRYATERGARWWSARCIAYGAGLSYRPYVELLVDALGTSLEAPPDEQGAALDALPAAAAPRRPWFARLLGLPSPETADLSPEAFQRGLHAAFADLLRAIAATGPLVVSIEDLHWLDAASRKLTAELVRLCDAEPVLLHLTARPEAAGLLAELAAAGDGRAAAVVVGPLDAAAVAELATAALGDRATPVLVGQLAARTRGNPFFVEEMVRSLADPGPGDAVDALDRLPPTIEGVLSARIDRLASPARAVLGTASVIGARVRLPLLRAVVADAALDERVSELVASGFLEPDDEGADTLRFHHALVQDVAYARLLRKQKRTLHLQVAKAAEDLWGTGDEHLALLARHHHLAESDRALDLLVRAGEVAAGVFANDEAVLHLRRAAEVAERTGATDRLGEVLLRLAELLEVTGAYEEALVLYERARSDTGAFAAWRGVAATNRLQGRYDAALEQLDVAFATLGPSGADAAALWLERGRTHLEASQFAEAVDALQAGLDAGGRTGRVAGQLLVNLALAERHLGGAEQALATARDAERLAVEHGDAVGEVTALRVVGDIQYALGRHEEAAATLRRGVALAERVGSVEELGGCLINLGMVELERGDLEAAIACDERAIEEFERARHAFGRAAGHGNLAEKLLRAGRVEEATACCERALGHATALGDPLVLADVLRTRAALHLGSTEFAAAARCAEAAAGAAARAGDEASAGGAWALAADAWEQAGDAAHAARARARAAPSS